MTDIEPRKEQITKEDFDNAVKQPWSTGTCIVAQCMKRLGLPVWTCENPEGNQTSCGFAHQHGLAQLQETFDKLHYHGEAEISRLRDTLPIEFQM